MDPPAERSQRGGVSVGDDMAALMKCVTTKAFMRLPAQMAPAIKEQRMKIHAGSCFKKNMLQVVQRTISILSAVNPPPIFIRRVPFAILCDVFICTPYRMFYRFL